LTRRHPRPTPFPYTTLFRSLAGLGAGHETVIASAGTQVEHRIARLDASELRGEAAAQAEVSIGGIALQRGVVLAHDVVHLGAARSEEHTSELQSRENLVCRL